MTKLILSFVALTVATMVAVTYKTTPATISGPGEEKEVTCLDTESPLILASPDGSTLFLLCASIDGHPVGAKPSDKERPLSDVTLHIRGIRTVQEKGTEL